MKYLITGGAGFIGSNIAEKVLSMGDEVRILDNFSTGREENLNLIKNDIDLIRGDLRDYETVKKAASGMDYVLHQGALPSVPRSIADPITTSDVNTGGTLNILKASLDAGVKRVVAASSSSIYGNSPTLPKVEDMPMNPMSPYAVAKMAAELYCRNFYHVYGLETVALRYFNVFGPKQDPTSKYSAVIPLFFDLMKSGKSPTIHGDGSQSRDFTNIANVVDANLKACTARGAAGEMFNIGYGENHTLLSLVENINHILGVSIEPIFGETRQGDVKHSLADISKARSILGYEPSVDFKEGLQVYFEVEEKIACSTAIIIPVRISSD